jgi:hypothetical protein
MNRTFSPFFSNGDRTETPSCLGYVMFDISKPLIIERQGSSKFEFTNSVDVSFESIPEYLENKDKYSITLSTDENVKVWWENKSESGFTIRCEVENWEGTVDWKIILKEEIPATEINNMKKQETFEKYDEI